MWPFNRKPTPPPRDHVVIAVDAHGVEYDSALITIAAYVDDERRRVWRIDPANAVEYGALYPYANAVHKSIDAINISEHPVNVFTAMCELSTFICGLNKPIVWGVMASIDLRIIRRHLKQTGNRVPWSLADERCARTLVATFDGSATLMPSLSVPAVRMYHHRVMDILKHKKGV